MNRQGKHAVIRSKNLRCAIALVNIQIDDSHAQGRPMRVGHAHTNHGATSPLSLHQAGGHRHIVENTKSATVGSKGMVGTPG